MRIIMILGLLVGVLLWTVVGLHQGYKDRIAHDLLPFRDGISEAMLALAADHPHTCRVVIRGGKLVRPHCGMMEIQEQLFDELAPRLPDLDFVINHIDEPRVLKRPCDWRADWMSCACDADYSPDRGHGFFLRPQHNLPIEEVVPVFSGCTIRQCFADILMPSFYHLWFRDNKPEQLPWTQKTFGAVWRGTSTGSVWNPLHPDYPRYHRQRLVALCQRLPDCDARFAGYLNCSPELCKEMEQRYGPPQFMSMNEQFRRKIAIDIDGNTFSRRFPFYLLSGSVVFKLAVFEDIGTILPQPWEHYVPLKMDLSDFEEKLEWARRHDIEMQAIGERGKQLAEEHILLKDYKDYMFHLLTEYSKLLLPSVL